MTTNQTNNELPCEQFDDSLPRCLGVQFPDSLKESCIVASLNGHYNPLSLSNVEKWENFASFTANGNASFMMRGARGYIAITIVDGQAVFIGDDQFWSENPTDPIIDRNSSPYDCLTSFWLLIDMINLNSPAEEAELALEKIVSMLRLIKDDGYIPKLPLEDIAPFIESLVLDKLLESKVMVVDYDFNVDYSGPFMAGSLNRHTFEVTQRFCGNKMQLSVNITSDFHLNKSNMVRFFFGDNKVQLHRQGRESKPEIVHP